MKTICIKNSYLKLCVYLCSCMHIMSIICSTADAISSGSCPILFKVLTVNVAICSICLHFSSFCHLSSVADFSNTEARAPTSAGHAPFSPVRRAMRFVYGSWLSFDGCFILFYRSHSYRGVAVVPRLKRLEKKLDCNYTRMLRAILNKSWRQHPTRHQLYGHLPPITKTIQVRRTRHAGHCWRSRDEVMYSYGPPHMAVQKQDNQHKHTFSNYVRIQDVVQKTCLRR